MTASASPAFSNPPSRRFFSVEEMGWQFTADDMEALGSREFLNRPKVLVEEETGAFMRLVVSGNEAPYYQELPLESETIYHLDMTPEAKQRYASLVLPTLHHPYSLHTFGYKTPDLDCPSINLRQIHAILGALGRPYRWMLTEQPCNILREAPSLVNLIYHRDEIVGAHGWSLAGLKTEDRIVRGSFFLFSPQCTGVGLGKYLFDFSVLQKLSLGALSVHVRTSDQCADRKGVCAKNFYQRQGWEIIGCYPFTYDLFKSGEDIEVPMVVPEAYFRDPKTGEELPRFRKKYLDERLAKVSHELLASASPSLPENISMSPQVLCSRLAA